MKRKDFLAAGLAGALGSGGLDRSLDDRPPPLPVDPTQEQIRRQFPRLESEAFLNGAGGTPLSAFTETAIDRYLDVARFGNTGEQGAWWGEVWGGMRGRFAALIGARPNEIGLVECTKAGEQLVFDRLPGVLDGGVLVSNDLHFQGSLHNLEGRRRAGGRVRIVPSDGSSVPVERMIDAIDEDTALVTVSLVSNVTGHVEEIAEISRAAHSVGAHVFADVIQAAGIVPIDVERMGIDFAACSTYKWLFGIHGAGFLYVAERHQGTTLPDAIWPGGSRRLYAPFAESGVAGTFSFTPRDNADRYRPGHVNYLGYAAADAGLRFVERMGVQALLDHTVELNRYVTDRLDSDRFELLSPHLDHSPILAIAARDLGGLRDRLASSRVVVSTGGDRHDLVRISPAIYNDRTDMEQLLDVLHG